MELKIIGTVIFVIAMVLYVRFVIKKGERDDESWREFVSRDRLRQAIDYLLEDEFAMDAIRRRQKARRRTKMGNLKLNGFELTGTFDLGTNVRPPRPWPKCPDMPKSKAQKEIFELKYPTNGKGENSFFTGDWRK